MTIVNIGKWVLRNLFIGFILEEQRNHSQDEASPIVSHTPSRDVFDPNTQNRSSLERSKLSIVNTSTVVSSSDMIPAVAPIVSPTARSSPLLTPLIPLWRDIPPTFSSIPQSPMPMDITPTPISATNQRTHDGALASSLQSPNDYFGARTRLQSIQGSNQIPSDDFSGWSGPGKQEPQTPSTPSGLMGRLKNFGKLTRRPVNDVTNISTPESAAVAVGAPAPPLVSQTLFRHLRAFFFFVLIHLLFCLSIGKSNHAKNGRTTTPHVCYKTSHPQRRTATSISS